MTPAPSALAAMLADRLEATTWGHAGNPVVSVQPNLSVDQCKAIIAALRLQAGMEGALVTINECAKVFREYARVQELNGNHEGASGNNQRAAFCESALTRLREGRG
jgi:hypothetical protein